MQPRTFRYGIVIVIVLILAACNASPTPTATPPATIIIPPIATFTPIPTSTFTPSPTNTPKPTPTLTLTPTPQPTLGFGKTQVVAQGGYSFEPVIGYDVNVSGGQLGVFDKAGRIIISIDGVTSNPSNKSAEEIMDDYLNAVAKKSNGQFTKGISHTIMIDGINGTAVDLTGELFGKSLQGLAVIVMPSKTQSLFGLGVANTSVDADSWKIEGSRVFTALLNSVKFIKPSVSTGSVKSACAVSSDSTYGYTKSNAIKVGGGDFGGPPRERAYLDVLRGPNGEALTYERLGSLPFENTILDAYELKGLSKSITLYIDEYSYTDPKAPAGLICASPFTLTPP